ncbi:MAG: phosphatase PAP2 family protein [Thermoleophilia bacterium]|nr:phosphatase PAP2 family protein [Thermoleophilia bacterium]
MSIFTNPQLQQVLPVPTGINRLGFPTYGPLPGGVQNPPNAFVEGVELDEVRRKNAMANADPQARAFTEQLATSGGSRAWKDFAHQYRQQVGFLRGWLGTGLMHVAMGTAALQTKFAKSGYDRLHPFEIDRSIRPIGALPRDSSYPNEDTAEAYAASTVLSQLWPARAYEFNWWARQTGLAKVAAGTSFPSDVQIGARLGMAAGARTSSLLW